MVGLGTVINVGLILAGGVAGRFVGNRLQPHMQQTVMDMTGVGVLVLGLGGAMARMLTVAEGRLSAGNTIMMIVSLALGAVIGEALGIEKRIKQLGEWLRVKSHSGSDTGFVNGFVAASCTVCIGAMAVMGSIQDGVSGDYSILLAKGIIDAIIVCIMTVTLGKGCVFSAVPVGVVQGLITLSAFLIGDFLPQAALDNLSFVGSILIFCVGLNLIRDKQICVANALPAIVVAVLWGCF